MSRPHGSSSGGGCWGDDCVASALVAARSTSFGMILPQFKHSASAPPIARRSGNALPPQRSQLRDIGKSRTRAFFFSLKRTPGGVRCEAAGVVGWPLAYAIPSRVAGGGLGGASLFRLLLPLLAAHQLFYLFSHAVVIGGNSQKCLDDGGLFRTGCQRSRSLRALPILFGLLNGMAQLDGC